ncbi:MAG: N-6 DNA methylase, partial [Bacteroidota bacterium]|nr:N-6 DNA methylase [Bacteroidota bacterium]
MQTKETAYKKIAQLVERFDEQYNSYKKTEYNETLTRRDFIDPFFKALGWDIDNENGYAESYREVIHEDRVKIGKATKAPDYSFRLSGTKRLFFVEAKKPSIFIKNDIIPAYQVRRYGWNAKLAVSIVTDFEELAVYDCTKQPKPTDKASVARIKYLTYKDYLTEFDFLWNTFSKESVLKGSFDKFILGNANKKGTATVDTAFLQSLDSWRTYLATSISWNNKELDEDELNFVVQQTIDRLIFLRIAEDRGVEPYGAMQQAIKQGDYYQNLFHFFKLADDKYNSGLFDFKKDSISKDIKVDNKVVKTIINELYYPESPYEFSVLPVEILGSAYEQFLGKQIKIDKAHRAYIEEKPEVRKAGGVYYTPQYIVDYIVKNTIGKLIDNKAPKDISKIKIVDPACGSGSFLIGAFDYLLRYHQDYYIQKSAEAKKDKALTPTGALTTSIKKQILLNNIYGVDIDVNAVEVTKLSLLLKCMEGETEASIATQHSMFNERVLPTLDSNIKDGNSLIDTDYYDAQLDFGGEKKIKPFNWKKAFPEVFKISKPNIDTEIKYHNKRILKQAKDEEDKANELIKKLGGIAKESELNYGDQGGFDVVIGNPPWGAEFTEDTAWYIRTNYISAYDGSFDSYSAFTERALSILRQGGVLGFITPDTFLRKDDFYSFRKYIFLNYSFYELIETGPVFSQVRDTWCCIFFINKSSPKKNTFIQQKKISRFVVSAEERLDCFGKSEWDADTLIEQSIWANKEKMIVGYKASKFEQDIIEKIEKYPRLGLLSNYQLSRGEEGSKYNIKESLKGDYRMVIPADIKANFVAEGKSINSEGLTPNKLKAIYSHPKIWITRIQKMRWKNRIVSAIDMRNNSAGMKTLQTITSNTNSIDDLCYLQCILFSKLINFYCINYLSDDMNQSY